VAAENFQQHAEHYFRVSNEHREGAHHGTPPPTTPADVEMNPSRAESGEAEVEREVERAQPGPEGETPGFGEPSTS
jgi:hypothetical protein